MSSPPGTMVCGVDHSPGARTAADIAIDLAARLAARLVLVHAVPLPRPSREVGVTQPTSLVTIERMREVGASLLEEIAAHAEDGSEIAREVRIGAAAEVLGTVAHDAGAECVVVGSRGLGRVGAVLHGSVSLSFAAHGPCPTLIVPEVASPIGDGPVVCAVDDTDGARAALLKAADLATRLDRQLLLVTVKAVDDPTSAAAERPVDDTGLGISPEWVYLRGEPAGAILEAAAARRAAVIVIGSRGRGALAASVLGSVSSAVAGGSRSPVMVVRAAA